MRIRAYSATGELDLNNNVLAQRDAFTMGTRALLTCDVTGLPQGDKVLSYRWEHNCTGGTHGRCEIQDGDPYYRVVSGTLLVDVTSWDLGGRYYCFVQETNATSLNSFTPKITVAGGCTHHIHFRHYGTLHYLQIDTMALYTICLYMLR